MHEDCCERTRIKKRKARSPAQRAVGKQHLLDSALTTRRSIHTSLVCSHPLVHRSVYPSQSWSMQQASHSPFWLCFRRQPHRRAQAPCRTRSSKSRGQASRHIASTSQREHAHSQMQAACSMSLRSSRKRKWSRRNTHTRMRGIAATWSTTRCISAVDAQQEASHRPSTTLRRGSTCIRIATRNDSPRRLAEGPAPSSSPTVSLCFAFFWISP